MPGGLEPRGPAAEAIAELWWQMLWLGVGVFVLFGALLGLALFHRRDASHHEADEAEESARYVRQWIVPLGVVLTTIVLIVVLVLTVGSMRRVPARGSGDVLRLDLVAHQWYWDVRYPGADVSTRDVVRIPVGRDVELSITSEDVIHSFWVPALAGKLDALPGTTHTLVIRANEAGTYRGQCAEFCGLNHARMRISVVAMEPVDFAAWLEGQA